MRNTTAFLSILLGTALAAAGPVDGPNAGYKEIPGGTAEAPGEFTDQAIFRGGQRACVVVAASGEKTGPLELIVRNASKQVVAQDRGEVLLGAVWYPTRDEAYTVILRNPEGSVRKCWVVLK